MMVIYIDTHTISSEADRSLTELSYLILTLLGGSLLVVFWYHSIFEISGM